jgi:hypothetical protein
MAKFEKKYFKNCPEYHNGKTGKPIRKKELVNQE